MIFIWKNSLVCSLRFNMTAIFMAAFGSTWQTDTTVREVHSSFQRKPKFSKKPIDLMWNLNYILSQNNYIPFRTMEILVHNDERTISKFALSIILRGLSFFLFLVFFLACFEKLTPRFSGFSGFITWPLLQYHTDNWRIMSRTKRQWADNWRQAICLLTGKSMQIRGIKELSISNKEGVSAAANRQINDPIAVSWILFLHSGSALVSQFSSSHPTVSQ